MLKPYHHAWLSIHPERSAHWLSERLKEGFDMHHIDGDHSNNDPVNLVLIEHKDHMRIHGSIKMDRMKSKKADIPLEFAKKCYEMKASSGLSWYGVSRELKTTEISAIKLSKTYADINNLDWPLPVGRTPKVKLYSVSGEQ